MEEEGRFAQENQCSKQNSDLQQVCQFNDLTSQLIKCGQILMHKTGKKRGQENILEILFQYESMSQKQLQEVLGIEAGSLSEILSKLEEKEMTEQLYRAIDGLPEQKKAVCLYKLKDSLSNQEIAEKMQISIPTVKTHYSQAIKLLREHFDKLLILLLSSLFS